MKKAERRTIVILAMLAVTLILVACVGFVASTANGYSPMRANAANDQPPEQGEKLAVTLTGYDLAPGAKLQLYFYLDFPEEYLANGYEAVVYKEGAEKAAVRLPLAGLKKTEYDDYEVPATPVAAKEMGDVVCVYVTNGNAQSEVFSASVLSYAQLYFAQKGADQGAKLLVSMLNYGAECQSLFGYKTDAPVNAGLEPDQQVVPESDILIFGEEDSFTPGKTVGALTYFGMAVFAEENNKMELYFTVAQGADVSGYTVDVEYYYGTEQRKMTGKGEMDKEEDMYIITVSNISPALVNEMFFITIHTNGKEDETCTFARSVRFYIQSAFSSGQSSWQQKATLRALYEYGKQASTLFGTDAYAGITAKRNSDEWTLTGMTGTPRAHFSLPSRINGEKVTEIAESAFCDLSCESLTLPAGISHIDHSAFFGISVKKVYYTGDLSGWCEIDFITEDSNPCHIGADLFIGGALLTDFVAPAGIAQINPYAFCGCTSLVSVTVPEGSGVRAVGTRAFAFCPALTTAVFGESVKEINEAVVEECTALCSVFFAAPETFDSLFERCFSLRSVAFGDGTASGILSADLFSDCYILEDISAPYSIVKEIFQFVDPRQIKALGITSGDIEDDAFNSDHSYDQDCLYRNIESLTLGKGVKKIGERAFYSCAMLKSVTIEVVVDEEKNVLNEIGKDAFKSTQVSEIHFTGRVNQWTHIPHATEKGSYFGTIDRVICSDGTYTY